MTSFMQRMGQNPTGAVAKTARQSAVAVAKRVAQEQLETLKAAKTQVGLPSSEQLPQSPDQAPGSASNAASPQASGESNEQMASRLNAESRRLLENLEAELAQIRRKKEQEDLQKKQQVEQQKVVQSQEDQSKIKEAPTLMGKMRKAMGGMKKKVQGMAGKREQQKNVSG